LDGAHYPVVISLRQDSDLINQHVAVHAGLTPDLPVVAGDGVQIQQVLLNLVVNGCDAMAEVGTIERRLLLRTTPPI
jgi:C4-dicarboxylate-specific signal transduction histidine kinase